MTEKRMEGEKKTTEKGADDVTRVITMTNVKRKWWTSCSLMTILTWSTFAIPGTSSAEPTPDWRPHAIKKWWKRTPSNEKWARWIARSSLSEDDISGLAKRKNQKTFHHSNSRGNGESEKEKERIYFSHLSFFAVLFDSSCVTRSANPSSGL